MSLRRLWVCLLPPSPAPFQPRLCRLWAGPGRGLCPLLMVRGWLSVGAGSGCGRGSRAGRRSSPGLLVVPDMGVPFSTLTPAGRCCCRRIWRLWMRRFPPSPLCVMWWSRPVRITLGSSPPRNSSTGRVCRGWRCRGRPPRGMCCRMCWCRCRWGLVGVVLGVAGMMCLLLWGPGWMRWRLGWRLPLPPPLPILPLTNRFPSLPPRRPPRPLSHTGCRPVPDLDPTAGTETHGR